jgi:DNA-directed RNA polymerase beta' subunit
MSQITNVNNIQFGILSDVDIEKMSVCEINKPTLAVEEGSVYDPRLGCVDNDSLCETCNENIWKCTGHFGHIKLQIPIILFFKQTVNMLKIFCFNCSRLLCTEEELRLQNVHGYEKTIEYLTNKISFCGRCTAPHPEIRFDISENKIMAQHKLKNEKTIRQLLPIMIKQIFDNIPDEDVAILGVDPKMFHPRNLVLKNFPVIPTCCRPRMITPDNVSDDDLSISLVEIIKNNKILEKGNLCIERYEKICADIKFRTLTYCDNSRGKAIHNTNHKPMTGIKERITKKTGHVRQNLMGKRGDKTGRTVVGPDTTLRLNEVAIPEEMANILTIPEYVNPFNIESLSKLVNTPGKASVVIKKNGMRISVATAIIKRGTLLNHGDIVKRKEIRNGVVEIVKYVITNCKMELKTGDIVTRPINNGESFKIIPVILPEKKIITIEIGDKVERYLKDGDFILLNRQPTLHRNSMQGMKVLIKPGRTIRLNLSVVTGFNMDFDGPSWTSNYIY